MQYLIIPPAVGGAALSKEEISAFDHITRGNNMGLKRGYFDGKPCAFICCIVPHPFKSNGEMVHSPVAMILDEEDMDLCADEDNEPPKTAEEHGDLPDGKFPWVE